jgi:hypothetical protein
MKFGENILDASSENAHKALQKLNMWHRGMATHAPNYHSKGGDREFKNGDKSLTVQELISSFLAQGIRAGYKRNYRQSRSDVVYVRRAGQDAVNSISGLIGYTWSGSMEGFENPWALVVSLEHLKISEVYEVGKNPYEDVEVEKNIPSCNILGLTFKWPTALDHIAGTSLPKQHDLTPEEVLRDLEDKGADDEAEFLREFKERVNSYSIDEAYDDGRLLLEDLNRSGVKSHDQIKDFLQLLIEAPTIPGGNVQRMVRELNLPLPVATRWGIVWPVEMPWREALIMF